MKIYFVLMFVFAADGAYEGNTCEKDGVTGVCTKIENCPGAIETVRKDRSLIKNCGFIGLVPIVCCITSQNEATTTTRTPVLTTTKRTTTRTLHIPGLPNYVYLDSDNEEADVCPPIHPSMTSNRTGRIAWDKCLEYQEQLVIPCVKSPVLIHGLIRSYGDCSQADQLIVGGSDAKANEFPHMAFLGYGDDVSALVWLCGGTLISEKFVLTAGHCISTEKYGPVTYVVLGKLKLSDGYSDGNRFKVKQIIKYPEYKPPQRHNDLALLELEINVPLNGNLYPACLHTGDPIDEHRVVATGWGNTKYKGPRPDVLQKVVLTKYNDSECAEHYPHHRLLVNGFNASTQICYGDRTQSKDTCQGDSGGPLQVRNKKIACMYTIIGITSFGRWCGFIGQPGMYTRVAYYVDWIESIVWP